MNEDYTHELWQIRMGEIQFNGTHVKFDTSPYVAKDQAIVLKLSPNKILVVSGEKLTQEQALRVLNDYYEGEALKSMGAI